jgi:hypothetical protein
MRCRTLRAVSAFSVQIGMRTASTSVVVTSVAFCRPDLAKALVSGELMKSRTRV